MSEDKRIEIKKGQGEVYMWECPVCHRIIKSLYPETLWIDAERHLQKHERKGGVKNE